MACCSLLPVVLTVAVGHPPWSLFACRERLTASLRPPWDGFLRWAFKLSLPPPYLLVLVLTPPVSGEAGSYVWASFSGYWSLFLLPD